MTDLQKNVFTLAALAVVGWFVLRRVASSAAGPVNTAADAIATDVYGAIDAARIGAGSIFDEAKRTAHNVINPDPLDMHPYYLLGPDNKPATVGGKPQTYFTSAVDAIKRNAATMQVRASNPNAGFILSPATTDAARVFAEAVRAQLPRN